MNNRSKNLGPDDVNEIVEILDGWEGRLSWELLIEEIAKRKFARYTRQALHKHERIKTAFADKKAYLATNDPVRVPRNASPELEAALLRIARLEAANARLQSENDRLLERYVLWTYNASTRGLDETFLNTPLPRVNRQQTKVAAVAKPTAKPR